MLISLYKLIDEKAVYIYTIHDRERLLDFPYSVTTNWRKNTGRGRERTKGFTTVHEKNLYIQKVFKEKIKQGYRILYSFEKTNEIPIDLAKFAH